MKRAVSVSDLPVAPKKSVFISEQADGVHDAIDESLKESHRERIAKYFAKYTRRLHGHGRRCFSLPGSRWVMERMLSELNLGGNKSNRWMFIGAERRLATLETGQQWMPRRQRGVVFGEPHGIQCAETDRAKCVHLPMLDLMKCINRQPNIGNAYGKWDCFWWDLQGPLISLDMASATALLPRCLNAEQTCVPFAITFLVGREHVEFDDNGESPLNRRIDAYLKQMRRKEWRICLSHTEQYSSSNGSQMGLMIGTINRD